MVATAWLKCIPTTKKFKKKKIISHIWGPLSSTTLIDAKNCLVFVPLSVRPRQVVIKTQKRSLSIEAKNEKSDHEMVNILKKTLPKMNSTTSLMSPCSGTTSNSSILRRSTSRVQETKCVCLNNALSSDSTLFFREILG